MGSLLAEPERDSLSKYLRFLPPTPHSAPPQRDSYSPGITLAFSKASNAFSKHFLFAQKSSAPVGLRLGLRTFNDSLHFSVELLVHLLWLPLYLKFKLACILSPPLILKNKYIWIYE